MLSVVVDVDDELVADSLRVRSISHELRFDDGRVSGKKEVHACARTGVARRELLRSYIRNPRPNKRMQEVLNVIFRRECEQDSTCPAVTQRMHRTATGIKQDE